MKARYLLIDDEPLARTRLQRLLLNINPDACCIQAEHGVDGLQKWVAEGPWSAVFLDVEMPGLSGFDVLARLPTAIHLPPIVFCTAFARYAVRAFEEAAIDYLVKPVAEDRLREALQRVTNSKLTRDRLIALERQVSALTSDSPSDAPLPHCLTLRTGDKVIPVPFANIMLCQAEQKLTSIITEERTFLSEKSLDMLERELPSALFFRCHRAAIINLGYILTFHNSASAHVVLRTNIAVPVSRRKKTELLAALQAEVKK